MNTSEPFTIITPEHDDFDTEDNAARVASFRKAAAEIGLGYREVVGYHDGLYETAFVLKDTGGARLLAIMFNQNRALEIDANHQAWHVNPLTGESEWLGEWYETKYPEVYESFTYDPHAKRYWTAAGRVSA